MSQEPLALMQQVDFGQGQFKFVLICSTLDACKSPCSGLF